MPDHQPLEWGVMGGHPATSDVDGTFVTGYTVAVGGGVPWLCAGTRVLFRRSEAELVAVRATTCGLPHSQGPTMQTMKNAEGAIPVYLVDQRDIQATAHRVDAEREEHGVNGVAPE